MSSKFGMKFIPNAAVPITLAQPRTISVVVSKSF